MEGIKKIVNILVMLYLVAAALIYLGILNVGQDTNPTFYTGFFVVGGLLMLLELIVENLYIMTLKRSHVQTQQKINELKAHLYDHKQEIQDIRTRHAEEAAAATTTTTTPAGATTTTTTPAGATTYTGPTGATNYTTTTTPITAAPTGTEPVPPVVKPVAPQDNPNVIITPRPAADPQDPDRRLSDKSDT